jgi:alpha-tubulin suppressor-like RCC1 family protein
MTYRVPCSIFPVPIEGGLLFQSIIPAESHTCGITQDRLAYCWGTGWFGDGRSRELAPVPVLAAGGLRFESLSSGSSVTCGVTLDGGAYCWGLYVNLAEGGLEAVLTPVKVTGNPGFNMLTVGSNHICGLAGGQVYCWGSNAYGQLGITEGLEGCGYQGGHPCRTTPAEVPLPDRAAGVSAGDGHTCAWTHDGRAYCWGANDSGQLGNGSIDEGTPLPGAVAGGIAFRSLSLGGSRTCGVALDGAGYCWGYNGMDRGLGNYLFQEDVSPVPILVLAPAGVLD